MWYLYVCIVNIAVADGHIMFVVRVSIPFMVTPSRLTQGHRVYVHVYYGQIGQKSATEGAVRQNKAAEAIQEFDFSAMMGNVYKAKRLTHANNARLAKYYNTPLLLWL